MSLASDRIVKNGARALVGALGGLGLACLTQFFVAGAAHAVDPVWAGKTPMPTPRWSRSGRAASFCFPNDPRAVTGQATWSRRS